MLIKAFLAHYCLLESYLPTQLKRKSDRLTVRGGIPMTGSQLVLTCVMAEFDKSRQRRKGVKRKTLNSLFILASCPTGYVADGSRLLVVCFYEK